MNNDLETAIKKIQLVNKKLAELIIEKEQLTDEIISALGHQKDGQKTYEFGRWKIECKTPVTFSLDTKLYKSGEVYLDPAFNPVKESITYTVDKKMCEKYMMTAPLVAREALDMLITLKPGKPAVSIKDNC